MSGHTLSLVIASGCIIWSAAEWFRDRATGKATIWPWVFLFVAFVNVVTA